MTLREGLVSVRKCEELAFCYLFEMLDCFLTCVVVLGLATQVKHGKVVSCQHVAVVGGHGEEIDGIFDVSSSAPPFEVHHSCVVQMVDKNCECKCKNKIE